MFLLGGITASISHAWKLNLELIIQSVDILNDGNIT